MVALSGSTASLACTLTGVVFIPLFLVGEISRQRKWAYAGENPSESQQEGGEEPKQVAIFGTAANAL